MKRVLCLYPFDAAVRERLQRTSPDLEIEFDGPDGQKAVDAVEDDGVDAILSNYCPADLGKVPSLRWLALVGAGVEHLRAVDPWSRGVVVTNGSGLHAVPIAEYVIAGILSFAQNAAGRWENGLRHGWPAAWSDEWKGLLGVSLRGRTLTVVGYGSIGREVARLANAFGMRVVAVKARPDVRRDSGYSVPGAGDPDGLIPQRIVGIGEIAACFAESDYVVLALPWTPANDRIIGERALAALPSRAVVINVARGKILDERALADAVRRGAIRGAVLDVASTEPVPPDSQLWSVPNLVLTPHISSTSDPNGWWELVAPLVIDNVGRFAAGRELVNVVDGVAGY